MSDPALGLTMLALIVVMIMLGFPTAFTLMGLGVVFGYVAFYDPSHAWLDNRIFDLMVERTYGAMLNDTLLSIPLFVLMGYVMERAALVDGMFHSIQLAFRRLPASLAVATLVVCTFWGIASGLVGAVVVLMGVIAFRPMLRAGYDTRLASGVITAGGTLGILIPPSVMIIVYAAVAGQSVVKLYASAMLPGFFLASLYLVYIVGWALIDPKVAPPRPESELHTPVPQWVTQLAQRCSPNLLRSLFAAVLFPRRTLGVEHEGRPIAFVMLVKNLLTALVPLILVIATFAAIWWYVAIHRVAEAEAANAPVVAEEVRDLHVAAADRPGEEALQELGSTGSAAGSAASKAEPEGLQRMGDAVVHAEPESVAPPPEFYAWFWGSAIVCLALVAFYYRRLGAEQFVILKLLTESVMPLGILTILVLAVILFGITTATESAAVGAAGAFLLALHSRTLNWQRTKEAIFLTAKTTAMVCWLFVGSALFSAVFALLGGQRLVEEWVLGLNLTPVQFMLLSQAIIFVLGWPLEWTEIIVIFVPIFLPLLPHFQIDPVLWGTLVFVNLQAAFLSPPVAMSAFYLKGVSPPHVTLNQIFAGMMPYMLIVIVCMVFMYLWPGMTLWLPAYLYGK
jgi:TRAP-type mannitol/chloroaromatic compound transport system permease large subunit